MFTEKFPHLSPLVLPPAAHRHPGDLLPPDDVQSGPAAQPLHQSGPSAQLRQQQHGYPDDGLVSLIT